MNSGPRPFTICVVGAGPRGLSVLERICANERKSASRSALTIHVVDPYRPGPGKVWRTAQSRHLLMNTVASQVTVFTDHSVEMEGPVEEGPSLYEWAAALASAALASAALASTGPAGPDGEDGGNGGEPPSPGGEHTGGHPAADAGPLAEARRLGPDTYPSRALYGRYLEECFDRIVAGAAEHITVRVHTSRAVALDDTGPGTAQTLRLADGTLLTGLDAVVLALGHVPSRPAPFEARAAEEAQAAGLVHIPPANPADVDLSVLTPGRPVLLRGLGLNFFDHMALLTTGRGGRFERTGDRLRYLPSGREPRIFAGSRRGVPYHARGENEKGAHGRHLPHLLTPARIAELTARAAAGEPVNFGTDLWPLIAKEVESVYYGALLTAAGRDAERPALVRRYLAAGPEGERRLLDEYRIPETEWWSWQRVSLPYGSRVFEDRDAFNRWLLGHLAQDVREARAGNVSGPLKAALDVLRDLRNEIRLVVDHGRLDGDSYRDDLQAWYTPLNAYLSIGPPVSRIEELMALIEAGTVVLVGPGIEVRAGTGPDGEPVFEAGSDRVGGEPVRVTALVEARLPEPDVRRTDDPLLVHLLATGQITPYRIAGSFGTFYETGGVSVTQRPYRVVDAQGRAHPRRFAYGVPTEAVHWVTAAGIRPGVNSVTLGDSDAIARAVLDLPPVRYEDDTTGTAGTAGTAGTTGATVTGGVTGVTGVTVTGGTAGGTGTTGADHTAGATVAGGTARPGDGWTEAAR